MDNILGKESRKFWMGFAIIWIILLHVNIYAGSQVTFSHWYAFISIPFGSGFVGVDIFMFLSAYGLCHSLGKNNLMQFYLNRINKLIPLYIVFAIVYTLVFFDSRTPHEWIISWSYQFSGLSSIKNLNPDIDWFTPAILTVYVLFPIIYRLCERIAQYRYIDVVMIVLMVMSTNLWSRFIINFFVGRLPIVFIGIFTFIYIKRNNISALVRLYVCSAALVYVAPEYITKSSIIVPFLLYGFNSLQMKGVLHKVISFIGNYTFEIYLAQQITLVYFIGHNGGGTNVALNVIVAIVTTPILVIVFHYTGNLLRQYVHGHKQ